MELKLQSCPCAGVQADRPKSALHRPLEKQPGEQCSHLPLQQELIGLQVLWQPWQSSNMTFRQLPPLLPRIAGTF